MGIVEFKKFIDEFKNVLEKNKKLLDKTIDDESSKGFFIKYDKIIALLNYYSDNIKSELPENKKVAVCYSGKPEITLTYILDSMIYNNKITLVINGFKEINDLLIDFIIDSFKNINIKNQWINYSTDYNEIYLRDNENAYDEIVYIGGYYEYLQFKSFFRRLVRYDNYGFMKLLINKDLYRRDYEKIMKYCTSENISVEVYTDPDDFVSESREEDFSIVFCDMATFNQLKRGLRAGTILVNAFPYDEYKYVVKR